MSSSLFSVPVAVILNQRLISQRGGIISTTSQSEDSLRFKLFINSNPASVRYGLTLQISALRDMSKEHNVDQIPEHQAYIFFHTHNFVGYDCMMPSRAPITAEELEKMEISEEKARSIYRMVRTFWIKGDVDFGELRHLMFTSTEASIDTNVVPKLRSETLECELKRIFGTIKTANEIKEACLEVDCLLPAMKGTTDLAVWVMHDAAQEDLEVLMAKDCAAEKNQIQSASAVGVQMSWRPKMSSAASDTLKNEPITIKKGNDGNEATPRKRDIPALIDGKFVSPDNAIISIKESRLPSKNAKSGTLKTSPDKYLHPHTFDSDHFKLKKAEQSPIPKVKCEYCFKEGHNVEKCEEFDVL